jgi:hypothetical protein
MPFRGVVGLFTKALPCEMLALLATEKPKILSHYPELVLNMYLVNQTVLEPRNF